MTDPTLLGVRKSDIGLFGLGQGKLNIQQVHFWQVFCRIETPLLVESMTDGTLQEIIQTTSSFFIEHPVVRDQLHNRNGIQFWVVYIFPQELHNVFLGGYWGIISLFDVVVVASYEFSEVFGQSLILVFLTIFLCCWQHRLVYEFL